MRLRAVFALSIALCGTAVAATTDLSFVEFYAYRPFSNMMGPRQPQMTALRTEHEWAAFWANIEPHLPRDMFKPVQRPLPSVDFGKYTLLVAALGGKPSGGYSVAIEDVRNLGSTILVSVLAVRPGPNCVVTTGATYPVALALIPRTTRSIDFGVSNAILDCGGRQER